MVEIEKLVLSGAPLELSRRNVEHVYGSKALFYLHFGITLTMSISTAIIWTILADYNPLSIFPILCVPLLYTNALLRALSPPEHAHHVVFIVLDTLSTLVSSPFGILTYVLKPFGSLTENYIYLVFSTMGSITLMAVTTVPRSQGYRARAWFFIKIFLGFLDTISDFGVGVELLSNSISSTLGWVICVFGTIDISTILLKLVIPYQKSVVTRLYVPMVCLVAEIPVLYVSIAWIERDEELFFGVVSAVTTSMSICVHFAFVAWELCYRNMSRKALNMASIQPSERLEDIDLSNIPDSRATGKRIPYEVEPSTSLSANDDNVSSVSISLSTWEPTTMANNGESESGVGLVRN